MYVHFIKRVLDILCSLMVLPLFFLLCAVIGGLIVLEDGGPIFYNAPRLGYKGKVFKMYKFRSMKVNAPDIRNNDGTTFNSEDDPRVTKIGKFIRKTSIDEIPQFLNILRGEMSWVGPRPDLPDAMKIFDGYNAHKLDVFPGITGYSQVYYRNSSTLEERFGGDLYYADHVSFWLDVKLIFLTIAVVLQHKNVYRN